MKKLLPFLFVFLMCFGFNNVKASHIPSSNLTWTCDPNNPLCYTFVFTQVINCPSTNPATIPSTQFTFTNGCGLANPTMGTMTQTSSSYDVAQTCATATSTCAGGTVPGAWLATYEATVCFPADCDSWVIDYALCCRDASSNTSGASSQDMHVQSTLNTSTAPCNNGPSLTSSAIPYMCVGQNNTYCLQTIDPDADSTYFQMTQPLGDNGTPITFAAGYSYTNPLQNFSLDPTTGCMSFNQATTGNFVVAVLIESYDDNGNLISSIIHDYQIEMINCSNVPPNQPIGGGFSNLVGDGTQTGPSTLDLCYGDNFCLDVVFNDPDGANNLTITTNGTTLLPGATFSQTGTNPATGTLCWTAQPGALSNVITFDVEDDACPIVGTNSFSITFNIATGLYAGPDVSICDPQTAQLTASGSGSYTWSPAAGLSCTNCQNPIASPTTTTTYTVTGNLTGSCPNTDQVTVYVEAPEAGFSWVSSCQGDPLAFTDTSTTLSGNITNWFWDFGDATTNADTSNLQNPTYAYPNSGSYTVSLTITTDSGCTDVFSTVIDVFGPPVADFSPDTVCAGNISSFFDMTTTIPGIQSWSWDFDNDGNEDANVANPAYTFAGSGTFPVTLTVVDSNGCAHDTTKNVYVSAQPIADFSFTNECFGTANNFTDLSNPNGGTITNWSWDFTNDGTVDNTSQNTTNSYSSDGVYTVELHVETALGCVDSITQSVNVHPIPVASFTADTACFGTQTTFTDASNVSTGNVVNWNWDFGDATGTSVAQNPTYTYTSFNTFNATLIVTSDSGCLDTTSLDIYLHSNPVVDFSPDTVCAGNVSSFFDMTNTASGVQIWSWDFDNDGNEDDNVANPTYLFVGSGTFPVALSVVDNNGCVHDTTKNVFVSAQPTAAFTFSNECFGSATGFTDQSNANGGTITDWSWDFDNNGTVDNTNQNTSNGYASAGTYTAELHVETALGCVDSTTMSIVVNPIPVSNFSVDPVCFTDVSTFYDSSTVVTDGIQSWAWDFGDGVGVSGLQNPTYTYANPGTYPVTLTVTSDSNCINIYVDSARVYNLPTASFVTNNVCLNVAADFTDTSNPNGGVISTWEWDFENDGTTDDVNQNASNFYSSEGNYTVQLIVSTASGCADTVTQAIDIHPMPVADFTFGNVCYGFPMTFTDQSAVVTGAITNWDWDFGNANTSIVQNPVENYGAENVYDVELIVTTDNGCKDTLGQQVEVYPIPVVDFGPEDVCLNSLTQFIDSTEVSNAHTTNNIVNWDWDFGDGVGTSTSQSPSYAYANEGVYPATLTVVSNHGCTDSVTINVTVHPNPQVSFGAPKDTCAPVCLTFDNTSSITSGAITTWLWDFGDGTTSGAMNPPHCFENESHSSVQTFDVTLTAESGFGCSTTHTEPAMITAYPIPLADFTYTPQETDIYDAEISFIDQSIYGSVFNWNLGDGTLSTDQNPVHEYADSGSYYVTLHIENIYGCEATTHKTVIIDPTFAIWIPNTLTADNDGVNDFWFVDGYGIEQLEILVFDRWGATVFEGYQLDSKWDGTYKGKVSVQDTYVYKVRARDVFGEWHEFIGRVTLLK